MNEFNGWIDDRDLEQVQKPGFAEEGDGRATFPNRNLIVYDKHWYDGHCRRVKIVVTDEVQ